jgi:hypothetical protein
MIITTIFIFTPANQFLFRWLLPAGPSAGDDHSEGHGKPSKPSKTREEILQSRAILVNNEDTSFRIIMKRFDELVIKPILIRDYEARYVGHMLM